MWIRGGQLGILSLIALIISLLSVFLVLWYEGVGTQYTYFITIATFVIGITFVIGSIRRLSNRNEDPGGSGTWI